LISGSSCWSYQLLIVLTRPAQIRVGRLGMFNFPAGRYVYTGSGGRHPAARLRRHLSRNKRLHWHIAYLLAVPEACVVRIRCFEDAECSVNQSTPARTIIPSFGAGDCRARCGSHLKFQS
jgi:Uri superfamily endonuclease